MGVSFLSCVAFVVACRAAALDVADAMFHAELDAQYDAKASRRADALDDDGE